MQPGEIETDVAAGTALEPEISYSMQQQYTISNQEFGKMECWEFWGNVCYSLKSQNCPTFKRCSECEGYVGGELVEIINIRKSLR